MGSVLNPMRNSVGIGFTFVGGIADRKDVDFVRARTGLDTGLP